MQNIQLRPPASSGFIDGANICYEPWRKMELHAVKLVSDRVMPINFVEECESMWKAQEVAKSLTALACSRVMQWRNQPIHDALTFSSLPKRDISHVYDYLSKKLGMQPVGRLALIDTMAGVTEAGRTQYNERTAYVIKSNIETKADDVSENIRHLTPAINTLSSYGVAAHELTHLAGAQDKAYFTVASNLESVDEVFVPGTKVHNWPQYTNGSYLEEGFANLIHSMYFWENNPELIKGGVRPFKSPSGQILHIPERIGHIFAGHHEYTHTAWGVERLVALQPTIWDTLTDSRRYRSSSQFIRNNLAFALELIETGLAKRVDTVDANNLDAAMDVTARIEHIANRQKV